MLNSQNYTQDAKIIRSGEVITTDVDLKDPEVQVFYHQVPGACTFLPDGAQITFVGGQFATKNPDILAHFKGIADKPGALVYSRRPGSPIREEAINVAVEATEPAGNSASNTGRVAASAETAKSIAQQVTAAKPTAAQAVDPKLAETK